jgi:hypothetical protein
MRSLCLYASELGAAVRQNPFKHPCEVMLGIWKRYDPVHFSRAQTRVATQQNRRCPEDVNSALQIVATTVGEVPSLQTIVDQCCAKATQNVSLPTILSIAQRQVRKVLDQNPVCQQRQIEQSDVLQYVQNAVSGAYGLAREAKVVQESQQSSNPIQENNSTFHCGPEIGTVNDTPGGQTYTYRLGGRIDGTVDKGSTLVEIKNRKNRFMDPVPMYDVLQMHCYMHLLQKTRCDLIEKLHGGQTKTTAIPWDAELWAATLSKVHQFFRLFVAIYETAEWQNRILAERTMAAQRRVYDKLDRAFDQFVQTGLKSDGEDHTVPGICVVNC